MSTFSGFRSRWTTPAAWIAARPFATSRPTWRQSSSGTRSSSCEQRAQRLPLDVLHDEEVLLSPSDDERVRVERAHDVLVDDRPPDLGLAQEPLEEALASRGGAGGRPSARRRPRRRARASGPTTVARVDPPHPARAQLGAQAVRAERRPDHGPAPASRLRRGDDPTSVGPHPRIGHGGKRTERRGGDPSPSDRHSIVTTRSHLDRIVGVIRRFVMAVDSRVRYLLDRPPGPTSRSPGQEGIPHA